MLLVNPVSYGLGQDDVSVDPRYSVMAPQTRLLPAQTPAPSEPDSGGLPTKDPTADQPVDPYTDPYAPTPGPAAEKSALCPWWCWLLLIAAGAGTIGLIWYAVRK